MEVVAGSLKILHSQSLLKNNMQALQRILVVSAVTNLFLVALVGVLLRCFPFFSYFPLTYKNLLHGHSHFAFGGWVMPAILALILKCFPDLQKAVDYRHWRNISFLLLFSAYGMLIAFSIQGYKPVSIAFSTLSIMGGFYLVVVCWRVMSLIKPAVSLNFLKAGLFYFVLSSVGPFATGPLIAFGQSGSPIYFDAIYFYLHFQYNGWFLFAVLAFFYKYLEQKGTATNGKKVFWLMNFACVPTYFLSVLWHQPSVLFNIVGGLGAVIQCAALYFLLRDLRLLNFTNKPLKTLVYLSFISLSTKIILQLVSAFPDIALLAYHHRNFVIAYLHLVLLGFTSLFLLGWIIKVYAVTVNRELKAGIGLFIIAFVCSELLLIASPVANILGYQIPVYALLLLLFSMLLPLGIALFSRRFVFQKDHDSILR